MNEFKKGYWHRIFIKKDDICNQLADPQNVLNRLKILLTRS
jgi:hypothetical protein